MFCDFFFLFDFLSMKTGVNGPSKSIKQKNFFFAGILSATDEKSGIQIRKSVARILIRTSKSRIHNTGANCSSFAVCGMYRTHVPTTAAL